MYMYRGFALTVDLTVEGQTKDLVQSTCGTWHMAHGTWHMAHAGGGRGPARRPSPVRKGTNGGREARGEARGGARGGGRGEGRGEARGKTRGEVRAEPRLPAHEFWKGLREVARIAYGDSEAEGERAGEREGVAASCDAECLESLLSHIAASAMG